MEAYTYPAPRVSRMINEHAVPVQFNVREDPGVLNRYHTHWTPTWVLRDVDDVEYRRSVGPLNEDQFLAELSLAYGIRWLNSGHFERSVEELEKAQEYTVLWPIRHAENLYYLAAARYEATEDGDLLMSTWKELQEKHPGTEWDLKSRQLKIE